MDFSGYQTAAARTAFYPSKMGIAYLAIGLAGETGEVAEKVKKLIRDKGYPNSPVSAEDRDSLIKELGDILWYMAMIAEELDIDFDTVAQTNIDKLRSRQDRDTLSGSGDDR